MEREAQALVAEHKMLLRYFKVITKRYHNEVSIMIVCVESEKSEKSECHQNHSRDSQNQWYAISLIVVVFSLPT